MTASTTKTATTFRWRLWAVGGAHGWRVDTRRHLLAHLKQQGWQPKTLTVSIEAGATRFTRTLALTSLGGPGPARMRLKGPAFDLWLDLSRRAALEVYCNANSLAEVAHWADQLFADILPNFAWLVPWVQPVPPGLTELLGDLQGTTGPSGDFKAHGPFAPGLVSWLGPGVPVALRNALSALEPLRAVLSPKGMMRLNLPCGAEATIAEQLRCWPAARDACHGTEWFAARRAKTKARQRPRQPRGASNPAPLA